MMNLRAAIDIGLLQAVLVLEALLNWRRALACTAGLHSTVSAVRLASSLVDRLVQILLVSGSLREGSTNTAVLRTACEVAPANVRTILYAGMSTLPHFNPDSDREGEPVVPAVRHLREQIAAADAILICTPEYAGALPGALKNLLEWTVGDGGTYRKPIAWINAAGPAAPTGAADAHESLRNVLGYIHADIVEHACARVPVDRDVVGIAGTVTDEPIRQQIFEAVTMLANYVLDRDDR
jgi:chromate reductase, NAD(P)H dehydrogenase (quinone)